MAEGTVEGTETLIRRPREEIEADFNSVDARMVAINERLVGFNEDQKKQLDIFSDHFQEKYPDMYDYRKLNEEEHEELIAEISDRLDPGVIDLERNAFSASRDFEKFSKEFTPYLKEDYEALLQDLPARINYDDIFSYTPPDGKDPTFFYLDKAARQIYDLRLLRYQELYPTDEIRDLYFYSSRVHTLKKYKNDWEEKGFLLEKPKEIKADPVFGEQAKEWREQSLPWLEETVAVLNKFIELKKIYEPGIYFGFIGRRLKRIYEILSSEDKYDERRDSYPHFIEMVYQHFGKVEMDPAFLYAADEEMSNLANTHELLGHMPRWFERREADRQRIDAIDNEEQIRKIQIEGFEAPGGMVAVITPEEIRESLKMLSPDFLQTLRSISYKDKTIKLEEDQDNPNIETVGSCISYIDQDGRLENSDIEVYRQLFIDQNTGNFEKVYLHEVFLRTLSHELGHKGHQSMTYQEMIDWEEVLTRDRRDVSWYVKYARSKSEERGKREDFAESFKLFIHDPALLWLLSQQRYRFMLNYFEDRLKSNQIESFDAGLKFKLEGSYRLWEILGQTPEQARDSYLSAESL